MFEPPSPAALAGRGRVATLGMLIIDHFVHGDEQPGDEVLGGGGLYAAVGARLFLPPSHVGFIADVGDDFPQHFRHTLEGLGAGAVWFRQRQGPTTRALNVYSGRVVGQGHQTFKYLSPQLRLTPADYLSPATAFDTAPEWLHVVCDTSRAGSIADEAARFEWAGKMAWEPLIRQVEPGMTATYVDLARRFAIFSPNHLELQTILGPAFTTAPAERCAHAFRTLVAAAGGPVPAIIVRAGADGAYTLAATWSGWVPAFWRGDDRVVDPTGGGNAFMGGLLAGLVLTGDYRAAAVYGATAASFAIEQRGLPRLGDALWNGESAWARLREMAARMESVEMGERRGEGRDGRA